MEGFVSSGLPGWLTLAAMSILGMRATATWGAVIGAVVRHPGVVPPVLRRMAGREPGSAVASRTQQALQRVT